MWIVRLALRRPYTFVVAALLLVLMTPLVLLRTPTDIFPSINIPVVSVVWSYTGLDAEEMEQRFNYAQERALTTTVNDIEHIESTAYSGVGLVKVFFREGTLVGAAVAEVTAIAQTMTRQMPPGTTPPLIIRYSASTVPVLQYSISSAKLPEQEIFDIASSQIRVGLATVQGASMPWPYGGKMKQVCVDLDLAALKAKNLAPVDVLNAINAQNLIFPSGTAKIGGSEYAVESEHQPQGVGGIGGVAGQDGERGGHPGERRGAGAERLRAAAERGAEQRGAGGAADDLQERRRPRRCGVVNGVKAALPGILAGLSPDLEVKEFADQSIFVRSAISGVVREGVIAAALTALMILLFLGSWRSTLIIALSIPLSVLTSIAILSALGETINLMTLGGLALAVGILVDDATVAIENIHRHMASGKPLNDAILDGAQEIAMPAFVSTLCICIVFVPMFFLAGVAHYLFVPLAEAVVFAMLASYVLSRTLVPTLVMWFYRNVSHYPRPETADEAAGPLPAGEGHPAGGEHGQGRRHPLVALQAGFQAGFERFRTGYGELLAAVLQRRGVFAAVFLAFCLGSLLLVPQLGQDFFPSVDAGQFRLHVRAHSGTRIEEMAKLTDEVEAVIREQIPAGELRGLMDNVGIPVSTINLSYNDSGLLGTGDADILVSLAAEHRPTAEYVNRLRARLNRGFPGLMFYFLPADIVSQSINFGLPAPFDIQLVGRDQGKNRAVAARLASRIRQVPGAVDVRVQQPADLPKFEVAIDRTKASEMGLAERDVANSVLLSLSGSGQVQPVYWLDPAIGVQYLVALQRAAAVDRFPRRPKGHSHQCQPARPGRRDPAGQPGHRARAPTARP